VNGSSWQDTLRRLRTDFLKGAISRLEDMQAALGRLREQPQGHEPLRLLQRGFHGFSGAGGTYGFPEISRLGREGAEDIAETARVRGLASTEDLARWAHRIATLRQTIEASSPAAESGIEPPLVPESKPADILLVDDDPVLLAAMTSVLQQEGFAVRTAGTLDAALAAVDQRLPDGLIVDIRLPDGSGYALISHVRGKPDGQRPAALILSMLGGFLDKVEAIHCGVDGYFEKPPDWEALKRRLQHLLERGRPASSRVLCVEDDPAQAAYVTAVLGAAGYEVRVCDDPLRFESELIAQQPDLVLMDAQLPGGVSGFDLVRLLRQDERYTALPVVFATVDARVESHIEALRAGGDTHLLKPVPPPLLLAAVSSAIERSRFLRGLLTRDGLTRLLTHSAFLERAQLTLAQAGREGARSSAAWVMLDLDVFKTINDRHGHPVGDRVLATLAALLRRRLRQTDAIGRYGGEEFAVLLHDLSAEEAFRLTDRLREEFAGLQHAGRDGQPFRTTFSAGIAMLDTERMDLDFWRALADSALYDSKRQGRNRVSVARG
jgi:diguanylate cyclase (GGDEF)-like protein